MIKEDFLKKLKDDYRQHEVERRQIIAAANDLLFEAKKTIFSLQRNDQVSASEKLTKIEDGLKALKERFGSARLNEEGSYKAAVEEYLEAKTFQQATNGQEIEASQGLELGSESYLGGICDLIGELVRFATNQAAGGNFDAVYKTKESADKLMEQLLDFDMTGYLRTKYDQARGHLRKLEQMAYEIRVHIGNDAEEK